MEYGVFTSELLEIAQTRCWNLCLYCNLDKSIIGVKLYNGLDKEKTLVAICERKNLENKTVYAYETPEEERVTNDKDGIESCLIQWRMGTFYQTLYNGIQFQMITNKIEYIFMIQKDHCNIYCEVAVNVPSNEDMLQVQLMRLQSLDKGFISYAMEKQEDVK